MNFAKLYSAGAVKRYHTTRIEAQSLADHSWGVALVVMAIYPNGNPPSNILKAALTHDLHEKDTGDVPATTKWDDGDIEEAHKKAEVNFNRVHRLEFPLTIKEQAILKWADTFELCCYCAVQAKMGNGYAKVVLTNGLQRLEQYGFPTTEAKELYDVTFSK